MLAFLFLLIEQVFSLELRNLDSTITFMYRFDIPATGILSYNLLVKKYNLKDQKKVLFGPLEEDEIGVNGLMLVAEEEAKSNYESRTLLFDQEYFTDTTVLYKPKVFTRKLGAKNNFNFSFPDISMNNHRLDGFKIGIEADKILSHWYTLPSLKKLYQKYLTNTINAIYDCAKICKELASQSEKGIYQTLVKGDYILLFFDKDYKKIITFLKSLMKLLLEPENNLSEKVTNFLYMHILKYIDNDINPYWDAYFNENDLPEDESKINILLGFLLTDLINLFELNLNPEYNFEICEINRKKEVLLGKSTIMIELDSEDISSEFYNNISVKNDKNQEVKLIERVYLENKLYLFLDDQDLCKSNIKYLHITLLSKCIYFESNIYLNEELN